MLSLSLLLSLFTASLPKSPTLVYNIFIYIDIHINIHINIHKYIYMEGEREGGGGTSPVFSFFLSNIYYHFHSQYCQIMIFIVYFLVYLLFTIDSLLSLLFSYNSHSTDFILSFFLFCLLYSLLFSTTIIFFKVFASNNCWYQNEKQVTNQNDKKWRSRLDTS